MTQTRHGDGGAFGRNSPGSGRTIFSRREVEGSRNVTTTQLIRTAVDVRPRSKSRAYFPIACSLVVTSFVGIGLSGSPSASAPASYRLTPNETACWVTLS